ncbi:MAG: hypothetical protein K0R66_1002 [Gammaproteobacteria bacterium]|jgi:peptidoglycan/LPS O-acetylase OafA/YrhL|nr:hypothetical protein [Gammaproteobacteria bacterium]
MSALSFSSHLERRQNNFDLIRFIAASMVLFSHSYPLTGTANETMLVHTHGQMDAGSMAVYIFFIISGFLISQSYDRSSDILAYFKARILRIFPAMAVVLVLTAFVLGSLVTTLPANQYFHNPATYQSLKSIYLRHIYFTLPGVFTNNIYPNGVNGSLWTLPSEFLCYCGIAIVGLLGLKKFKSAILILAILNLFYHITHLNPSVTNPRIFDLDIAIFSGLLCYFSAGMVMYAFRDYILVSRNIAMTSLVILAAAAHFGGFQLLFLIFGSYLVIYIALSPEISCHNFARYGDFSYGMYLYAFPIQQTITHLYHNNISAHKNFLIAFPFSLIMAFLSWHLVEKHALKLKKFNLAIFRLPKVKYLPDLIQIPPNCQGILLLDKIAWALLFVALFLAHLYKQDISYYGMLLYYKLVPYIA